MRGYLFRLFYYFYNFLKKLKTQNISKVTCAIEPCQNGGTCISSSFCDCRNPFFGRFCQFEDLSDCTGIDCLNGGVCIPGENFTDPALCNCTGTVYFGDRCEIRIESCSDEYCKNGGVCVEEETFLRCDCNGTGFTGSLCTIDIDDCDPNPCLNGGVCQDEGANSFSCDCTNTGFQGIRCQTDAEDCLPNPCQNGGICTDEGTDLFSCDCNATEYTGEVCQIHRNDCNFFPCANGRCDDTTSRCNCEGSGFTGAFCSLETVTCFPNPCENGGTCIDTGTNMVQCSCPVLFLGSTCGIEALAIIAIAAGLVGVVLVFLILKYFYPEAENQIVIGVALVLYDFITDCLFASSQAEDITILIPAVVFIAIPVLFNLVVLLTVFVKAAKTPEMERWLEANYAVAAGAVLLASTNIECILLLTSGLFNNEKFKAPLSDDKIKLLFILGLVGNVLEDIPQLALQSFTAAFSGLDTLVLLSIIGSGMTIVFGLLKRAFLFLVYRSQQAGKRADEKNMAIGSSTHELKNLSS